MAKKFDSLTVETCLTQLGTKSLSAELDVKFAIGKGTYGIVSLAVHTFTGVPVAVKQVRSDTAGSGSQVTLVEDYMREIRLTKQCLHPNVVRILGSGPVRNELWMVFELCAAGSMLDVMRIRNKSIRNEEELSAIILQTLRGLNFLHSINVVHRDIKAGNILLDHMGVCKLGDLGVAGVITDQQPQLTQAHGSPNWIAPEIVQQVPYNERVDIWSLGCTVIQLAEGNPPFSDKTPDDAMIAMCQGPPPTFTLDRWSRSLTLFTARCLTFNPATRPTASALLQDPHLTSAAVARDPLRAMADDVLARRIEAERAATDSPEHFQAVVAALRSPRKGRIKKHGSTNSPSASPVASPSTRRRTISSADSSCVLQ